jgi:hypothetical protein
MFQACTPSSSNLSLLVAAGGEVKGEVIIQVWRVALEDEKPAAFVRLTRWIISVRTVSPGPKEPILIRVFSYF